MKISFIGYGNMAKALAKSLMSNPDYELHAASPSLIIGKDDFGVATNPDNLVTIQDAKVIILAVKPFNMLKVLQQIQTAIPKNSLIISVATGLSLSWFANNCPKGQAIVRSMPNIAVSINQGATPLIANEFVSPEQRKFAAHLFESSGIITWLDKEDEIDVFTALSGSGLAYVFYFLESMAKAGEQMGLEKEVANRFSIQTVLGAAELAQQSPLDFAQLRQQVTSPAGTTAAALKQLEEGGFAGLMYIAMEAAVLRARELGKA